MTATPVKPESAAATSPEAPLLTRDQIRKELALLHKDKRRTRRSALYARLADISDDNTTIDVAVGSETEPFRIVATHSELHLRCKLAQEDDEHTAYVVPFARRLPRDIEASLASGRLFWPQIESLLPRRFGAKYCTPRVLSSKLRLVAQREGTRVYGRGEAPSIDLDDAWLVHLRNRLDLDTIPTEASFFAATLSDKEQRAQTLSLVLGEVPGAQEELCQVLERRLGASARWILSAWLGGSITELAVVAVLGEATRNVLTEGRGPELSVLKTALEQRVRFFSPKAHPLRPLLDAEKFIGLSKALLDLSYLVPLFWPKLSNALQDFILRQAEELFALEALTPLALGSDRLPSVLTHRCKVFLTSIQTALAAPDVGERVDGVDGAASELLAHDNARHNAQLRGQVEMATRLVAFLAEPIARNTIADEDRGSDIVRLAIYQADMGGWVDLARQVARDGTDTALGRGLSGLIAAVDRVRDTLNARFAAAYAQLVGAKGERQNLCGAVRMDGRSRQALPIEDVVSKMGLSVIENNAELKLLVLCMDGMSWANLVEIWGSIQKTTFVPVSQGPRLPVLAHVPTITRLSRSALFAGRVIAKGETLDTTRDEDRLTRHAGVRRMGETPRVFLRGAVLGEGGALSDDVTKAVAGNARIVGVVVNAIDDQLKGSPQLRVSFSTESIPPLSALLKAAESTGRLVLLTSDHGHVTMQRFLGAAVRSVGKETEGMERGARHRFLRESEAAGEDEIELPVGALAKVKGFDRVAVAVHETLRYTSGVHAGEHGGASLGEVVAPAVLLAPRGILPTLEALGIEEAPLAPPAFWTRTWARSERVLAMAEAPPRLPIPAPPIPTVVATKRGAQVSLPFEGSAVEPLPDVVAALFRSKLFKEQLQRIPEPSRPTYQKAIELLVRQGGRMAREPLAVALGIDTAGKGVRVQGFLARLEELLNLEQECVLEADPKSHTITLHLELLRALFLEDGRG